MYFKVESHALCTTVGAVGVTPSEKVLSQAHCECLAPSRLDTPSYHNGLILQRCSY